MPPIRDPRISFAVGFLAAVVAGGIAGFAYSQSGLYNVGASKPHTRFSEWLTHSTMIASVRLHSRGIAAPERATGDQVVSGFCQYEAHCVACHGAAAVARKHWAEGMEPAPPYLLDAPQRFTPPELFWIAKNGIKMTGMPSWRAAMTDRQIWDVVAYLEASTRLPPQSYLEWRSRGLCSKRA